MVISFVEKSLHDSSSLVMAYLESRSLLRVFDSICMSFTGSSKGIVLPLSNLFKTSKYIDSTVLSADLWLCGRKV